MIFTWKYGSKYKYMLRKDCNVSKASNISSLHRETQSFNKECSRVKILHVIDYQDMY